VRPTKSSTRNAREADLRLVLFSVAALVLSPAGAKAPQTTLRSQANVVVIPTLVKDSHGQVVYGLEAKDFIVEDDGNPQPVRLDEAPEGQPISLVMAVQTGRRAAYEFPRERGLNAMLDPIFAFGNARVALVEFNSQIRLVQEFTDDESRTQESLGNLEPGDGGAAILGAIRFSVNLLKQEPDGRLRVLLLISETRDHGSRDQIQNTVADIGQANVLMYALAFSPGLSNILDTERGNNNPDLHPEQNEMNPSPDLIAPLYMTVQAMRKNNPSTVASMTGGEYEPFSTHQKFDLRMTSFTNHLHSRYLLSIAPKNPQPGLHRLRVRLKDSGKNSVLARTSYWAEEATQ
jgi:VWFA-related protein